MIVATAAAVPVAWLVARAAGLVAFALLSVSVTLGLALSTRLSAPSQQDAARLAPDAHVDGLRDGRSPHDRALFDPTIHFGLAAVLVPGMRGGALPVAAGIVTAWLMLVLAVSFNVRRRIGQRRWRLLHYTSSGAFAIGLYHALNVGSDLTGIRGLVFAGVFAAPVVWLVYARILMPRAGPRQPPPLRGPARGHDDPAASGQFRAGRGAEVTGADMTRRRSGEPFRAMGTLCCVALAARAIRGRPRTPCARGRVGARWRRASVRSRASTPGATSRASIGPEAPGSTVDVAARRGARSRTRMHGRTRDGRFDPTILPALAAAGYDRSFELLTERDAVPLDGWHAGARIDVDPRSTRARVERGAGVDLGGIGKGFAATRALHAMRTAWPALTGALVDLGGDIGVWGIAPEGGPWRVDIADPRAPGRVAGTLELTGGGVATSGRDTRRFGPAARLHHLIDPATGVPAAAGPLAVTVVAANATEAEAHATALAVMGLDEARTRTSPRDPISGRS